MNPIVPSVRQRGFALAVSCVLLLAAGSSLAELRAAQGFGAQQDPVRNPHWQVLSTPHFEIFFYDEELAARAAVIAEEEYLRA